MFVFFNFTHQFLFHQSQLWTDSIFLHQDSTCYYIILFTASIFTKIPRWKARPGRFEPSWTGLWSVWFSSLWKISIFSLCYNGLRPKDSGKQITLPSDNPLYHAGTPYTSFKVQAEQLNRHIIHPETRRLFWCTKFDYATHDQQLVTIWLYHKIPDAATPIL